jgi:predicted TIM-barrel fold metal-dependent hydrolase
VAKSRLVDVHHHFLPDAYREAIVRSGNNPPDGIVRLPDWSEGEAVRFLDSMGIETAYLSISSPGLVLDGADVPALARMVNEIAADLVDRHPGRFGSFAALPLPDVDASLAEIARALDELHLDGIGLLTHHGDIYLGDPAFDAVFEELDRRHAVVFIHPTSPVCCEPAALGFPRPGIEFIFDTARTVMNLIFSGTLDRCLDISWIIPHGGGALPVLGARLDAVRMMAPDRCHASEPVVTYLHRFHYDLAGPRTEEALRALLGIADPSRLLYGSDWPFTAEPGVARMLADLRATSVFGDPVDDVLTANARRLLGQ